MNIQLQKQSKKAKRSYRKNQAKLQVHIEKYLVLWIDNLQVYVRKDSNHAGRNYSHQSDTGAHNSQEKKQ